VMADMARRLRVRIGDIDHLALQSATGRLVEYLVQQASDGRAGPVEIELTVPKHVLASRLSMQPETLSRILRRLTDEGLLRVEGRSVHVPDLERLNARTMAQHPARGGRPGPRHCR
jgi:CRP-like cAMP-binding protein